MSTKKFGNYRLGVSVAIHSKGSSGLINSMSCMKWGGDEPSLFINMFSGREQLKISQAIRCNQSITHSSRHPPPHYTTYLHGKALLIQIGSVR
ncbi:hypothetical protein TNCV_4187951 [Trichonephila clavipes]|nr:hypothetical protein TNCV_4187951 [Trichonephila clavipes]